ncbi:MAG: cyclic nucleotide-binding domain-containing protein [Desulfobacterales bacterium]|jgi:CRP/FNR family transcriptional regulator, cyclic AMP receptor protein|nr:cyclic nucleotide-binding domain-containing protein [Desulfobacteraceae bacterium]MBT4363776.1 cyclic nucleotide-binding domain-containing protein [Desulfobacteraceae bacterium]MBT7086164.1 cyclic nucleotide-binding domain-containing protein [Desulfobacterales bacterium]MBT7696529.1 cyclic nucleotide-binding domain-containing protein [Desulfobacterales bacterium]
MIESKYLKDNLQNIQKLMNIPALKNFETKSLSKLLKLSKIREYSDGENIIREGDLDPWLYFLLSGKVVVKKDDVEITRIFKVGEIFGEMRIVDSLNRSASVFSIGKTVCLAVDTSSKGVDSDSMDEKLDFLLLLYKIFAEYMSLRLRITNDEIIKEKKKTRDLRKIIKDIGKKIPAMPA